MKLFRNLFAITSLLSIGLLATACKKNNNSKPTDTKPTETDTSGKDTDAPKTFDPEVAMNNFLAKIDNNNYTMESNRLITNINGENLITLDYSHEYSIDRAIMTVDGEVFEGKITETGLEDVIFFKYGNSLDAATEQYRTLNIIQTVAYGNIWDIFTNVGNTGEYVTNSEEMKYMLAMIADYPKEFAGAMSEVTLTLDAENPTKATFDATSTITDFSTIHLEVTFGKAEGNQYAESWMENPIYPEAKTEWSDNDYGMFTALFYDDFDHCIPFVDGATYAFFADPNSLREGYELIIRDKHFKETDYTAYISKLTTAGFEYEEERDGFMHYHKMLRPEVKCYASIYLDYDEDGLYMEVASYYDCAEYDSFNDIATLVKNNGFVELPDGTDIIDSYAIDGTGPQMDSTLYINEYALVLETEFEFESSEAARAYLDSYVDLLLAAHYIEKQPSMFDINVYYQTFDEVFTVKWIISNNVLSMRFAAKKQYSLDQINGIIGEYGFPGIPEDGYDYTYMYVIAKNDKNYDHYQSGYNYELSFDVRVAVSTEDEAFYFDLDVGHSLVDTCGFEYDDTLGMYVKGDSKVRIKQTAGEDYILVDIKYIVE